MWRSPSERSERRACPVLYAVASPHRKAAEARTAEAVDISKDFHIGF